MEILNLCKFALDNSFDGILISDESGNVIYLNDKYEKITGLTKKQLLGHNLQDLEDQGLFSTSVSMQVIKTEKPYSTVHSYISGKTALTSAVPIFDNGELVGVVNNTRNLKDLKEIEDTVLQSASKSVIVERQNLSLKNLLNKEYNFVFASKAMVETINKADSVAPYDSTVLITGDSGTGKEVIARYIHNSSPRKEEAFIQVNCAAIPSELFESEIFGYEKGAFTGARESGKIGLFELANKGTILLDEVGDMPLEMQSKILRTIQEKEIQRLGSEETIPIDVRILASTNVDLEKAVKEKKFREDLYFRLSVFPIKIAPLKERKKDIEPLISFFLEKLNEKYKTVTTIDEEAIEALTNYSFPGNVRELENLVEYMYVLSDENISLLEIPGKVLSNVMLNTMSEKNPKVMRSLDELMDLYEKSIIEDVIRHHKTLVTASEVMGIHPSTLSRKMNKYNLNFQTGEKGLN